MNQRSTSLGHKRVSSQPTISITWVLEISPSLDDWKIARAVDLWTHQVGGANIFIQTRLGFSAFIFHPLGRLLLRILHTLYLTVGWWTIWIQRSTWQFCHVIRILWGCAGLWIRATPVVGPRGDEDFSGSCAGFRWIFFHEFFVSLTKETNHFLGVQ